MNKRNITLILAGILIQILDFTISIGNFRIDLFSDIIAYILILIGIMPLIKRNNLFKKSKSTAIKALVVSILVQAVNFVDFGEGTVNVDTFTKGIITILSIYFTYYFTESIILEAKMQNKSALTRNYRITWAVLGVFIFVYYIAFFTSNSILSVGIQAVTLICAIYYSSTTLTCCNQLYTEDLPEHSLI